MNMYDVIILTDRKALVAAVFSELYQNYDLNYDMNKTGMELHKSIINRTINALLDKCDHWKKTSLEESTILIRYNGSHYTGDGDWESVSRYALFDSEILSVRCSYLEFECLDFYYTENSRKITVDELHKDWFKKLANYPLPLPIEWNWNNAASIFLSPIVGSAKKYRESVTIELLSKYIAFSLKKIPQDSEMGDNSQKEFEEYSIDQLRYDVLLNKLGLYEELKNVYENE